MGLFDDTASVISRKSHHSSKSKRHSRHSTYSRKSGSRSRSRSRSSSPGAKSIAASFFGLDGGDKKKRHRSHDNRSSFFGLPNVSTRSFFGGGGRSSRAPKSSSYSSFELTFPFKDKHRSSTSHYRRSPRPNFLTRAYKQLKRLLRDLVYYAKRHPLKVFTLVVVPLITGGFLTALLARFGLRLPPSIERMLGMGARAMGGDTMGLVGEAVRMARGGGGDAHVRVERGRDGGLQWERKSWEGLDEGGFGGFGGLSGGWGMIKTVKEFFD